MTYPTADQLRDWLKATVTETDHTTCNNAAKDFVERWCNRVFVAASGTRVFRRHEIGRNGDLMFRQDAISLTSVVGTSALIVETDYYPLGGHLGPFTGIHINVGSLWMIDTTVTVQGLWGFSNTCPAAIFEAILEIGGIMYRAKSGGGSPVAQAQNSGVFLQGIDLPMRLVQTLNNYKRYVA